MVKEKRSVLIEEQYKSVKIKSIKRVKNTKPVYDLAINNAGSYCVGKNKAIGSNSDMGNKAKKLREFFRVYARKIEKYNVAMLVTNHYTQKIGVMYGSNKVTTGGTALPYAASVRIDLKVQELDIDKKLEAIGASSVTLRATTMKNRNFSPRRRIFFVLDFEKGVHRYSGLFQILKDLGIAKQAGAWCMLPKWDEEKKFYAKDFPALVEENKMQDLIQELLTAEIKREKNDTAEIENQAINEAVQAEEARGVREAAQKKKGQSK